MNSAKKRAMLLYETDAVNEETQCNDPEIWSHRIVWHHNKSTNSWMISFSVG